MVVIKGIPFKVLHRPKCSHKHFMVSIKMVVIKGIRFKVLHRPKCSHKQFMVSIEIFGTQHFMMTHFGCHLQNPGYDPNGINGLK